MISILGANRAVSPGGWGALDNMQHVPRWAWCKRAGSPCRPAGHAGIHAILRSIPIALLAVLMLLSATGEALAQSCSITMQNVAFGNVDVTTGSAVDTTATLAVTCSGFGTGGNSPRLCISIGVGAAGDATSRQMQSGANTLRYDLYSDSGRTTVWGSWETGYKSPGVANDPGGNGTFNFTVFGRVLASQQTALAGAYTSAFTVNPFLRYGRRGGGSAACPGPLSNEATTSTSFSVTATVVPACTISTASVAFGSVGLLTSNKDAQGSVTVTCTNQAPYNIGLGAGTGAGATVAARKMTNGANTVTYSLYKDTGRSIVWGNTIGTDTATGTGTGSNQVLPVYGRVPPQSTPPAQTYTDTVVATVTY